MENKFYKIGEVSKLLDLNTSTLRYWETEFRQLRPVKSSGGQRFYTQKHIELLQTLKQMLYNEKYTIDGAKKRLKTQTSANDTQENSEKKTNGLDNSYYSMSKEDIKKELAEILSILK